MIEGLPYQPNQTTLPESTRLTPETKAAEPRFKLMDNPLEVLADLQQEIDKSGEGDRVWLKGLDFQAGRFSDNILPNLAQASQRGAQVRITHNPISRYRTHGLPSYVRHIPLYPNRSQISEDYDETKAMLDKLENDGNIEMKLSRPETKLRQFFPYMGADHIKTWVVGDTAYFGDFNLEDETFFNMQGFMVKIKVPELVEQLAEIHENPPKESKIYPFKGLSHFVYDAGKRGESRIYDFTNFLIKNVEGGGSIFASLPLLPGHELLNNLDQAIDRNIQVKAVASRQNEFEGVPPLYISNRLAAKSILRKGSDLKFRFAPSGGLHGKSWVFESNGQKSAWFGSHNQVKSGVRMGTAELNMYTIDPELVDQIDAYHERLWEASRTGAPMYPTQA